jgi:uncharacterized membrane protein YbhN (UPF0104 family)
MTQTGDLLPADESVPPVPRRSSRMKTVGLLALKFTVTAGCLWYVTRNIKIDDIGGLARSLDPAWTICAVLAVMLQLPLAGLRLGGIVDGLGVPRESTPRGQMIANSSICLFFGQILPNPGGDAMRLWLLRRLGRTWGRAVTSVLIDRAVGVVVLLVLGFVTLLFPSPLMELTGNRHLVLATIGIMIVGGVVGFALIPQLAPILERSRITRPAAYLGRAIHRVFYPPSAGAPILTVALVIHILTILAIWSLARAEGLALPIVDAAVLFATIAVLSLLPISISGWGVRELAVTALLQSYGMSQAQGLFFSVSFGVLLIVAALPGAIVYAIYAPKPVEARAVAGHIR